MQLLTTLILTLITKMHLLILITFTTFFADKDLFVAMLLLWRCRLAIREFSVSWVQILNTRVGISLLDPSTWIFKSGLDANKVTPQEI